MSYQPVDQDQPTSYDCVPTTTSMVIDHGSAGVKRPGPVALRRAAGVPYPNGMSYADMEEAAAEVSNVSLKARWYLSRGETIALAVSGRSFGISISTRITRYTTRRTGTFVGNHTVYVNRYQVWPGGDRCACEKQSTTKHSEFRVQDPGTFSVGFQQWSADLLFRAAEARTGGAGINVLVGYDTEDVYREAIEGGWIRARPTTESRKIKRIEMRKYHVLEIVNGEAWWRKDGSRSTAWYRIGTGYYIRGDHLGTTNVARP